VGPAAGTVSGGMSLTGIFGSASIVKIDVVSRAEPNPCRRTFIFGVVSRSPMNIRPRDKCGNHGAASQQVAWADVSVGSEADIGARPHHVCFTPDSGQTYRINVM
jgi:hypothetical protein